MVGGKDKAVEGRWWELGRTVGVQGQTEGRILSILLRCWTRVTKLKTYVEYADGTQPIASPFEP